MKIVFSVLILLALDLVIFYITHNVTKTYVKEQRVIADNVENLITDFNTHKIRNYIVAVPCGEFMGFEEISLFHDNELNIDIVVPDCLFNKFVEDNLRYTKI